MDSLICTHNPTSWAQGPKAPRKGLLEHTSVWGGQIVCNTEALLQDLSTVSGPPRQAEGANNGTFTLTGCALPTQGSNLVLIGLACP